MVLSADEYKSMSAVDRAKLSIEELCTLYTEVTGRKVQRLCGAEIRNRIENGLGMKSECPCGSKQFLGISSRACDRNYYKLPSGKEGEGYLPCLSGIGALGGDGPSFDMCITCGRIYGFDKEELAEQIAGLERRLAE